MVVVVVVVVAVVVCMLLNSNPRVCITFQDLGSSMDRAGIIAIAGREAAEAAASEQMPAAKAAEKS